MASCDSVTSQWFLWLNHSWNGIDVVGRHASQFSFSAIASTAYNPAWLRDELSRSGSIWWVEIPRNLTVALASERECLKSLAVGGTDLSERDCVLKKAADGAGCITGSVAIELEIPPA